MTEREELIEILTSEFHWTYTPMAINSIADYLLANGVRIPVRCKDCKYRDPEDKKCDHGGLEHQGVPFAVSDDYFCADGERREDNDG